MYWLVGRNYKLEVKFCEMKSLSWGSMIGYELRGKVAKEQASV